MWFSTFLIEDLRNKSFKDLQMDSTEPLILYKQTSLSEEIINNQNVHVVVKNIPFEVSIKLNELIHSYTFSDYKTTVSLIYDCETVKQVSYIKHKPLDYTSHVKGNLLCFEVKVKVLTSQMEDMLFQLLFTATPNNKAKTRGAKELTVRSSPLRVVSKPHQIHRSPKSNKVLQNTPVSYDSNSSPEQKDSPSNTSQGSSGKELHKAKKRDRSQIVSDQLLKIQETQRSQAETLLHFANEFSAMKNYYESIISDLQNKISSASPLSDSSDDHECSSYSQSSSDDLKSIDMSEEDHNDDILQGCFNRLVSYYSELSPFESASKVRKVISGDESMLHLVAEVGDLFENEIQSHSLPTYSVHSSSFSNLHSIENLLIAEKFPFEDSLFQDVITS